MSEAPQADALFPAIGGASPDGRRRRRRLAVAAAACAIAVYLAGVHGAWWPTPDSALYQGLARSLAAGAGYRFNGRIDPRVTPGMPVILAGLRVAFGEGYWAPNLFVALCGLGALAMACATLAPRVGPAGAFAAVLATAACYKHYHFCHLILTDATFSLLFWLVVWAALRGLRGGWAFLPAAGLLAAAAVTVRAPGLLILGALGVGIVADRVTGARWTRRAVAAAIVVLAAAAAVGLFYLAARSIGGEMPYASPPAMRSGLERHLYHLGRGLAILPEEMAITFTGQRGLWPVALVLCLLAALGGVRLCRAGRVLEPVTCAVYIFGSLFLVSYRMARPRYIMAIQPMLVLMMLSGLDWVGGRLARWRLGRPSPKAAATACAVLIGLIVAVNLPKVLRDGLYYSLAAHRGRYHEVIRDGTMADLAPSAAVLAERLGDDAVAAARNDRVSMLHFLSGRRIVPLARTPRKTAAEAEAVFADLAGREDVRAVVHDTGGAKKPYARRLRELLDAAAGLTVLYDGPTCRVYRRGEPDGSGRP